MITRCGLLLVALVFSAPASADFAGDYAMAYWTIMTNGGVVDTRNAPSSVRLASNNIGTANANQDLFITVPNAAALSFDWNYRTFDPGFGGMAGPYWDPFGYLHNGAFFQLTANGGTPVQSGSLSLAVAAGDTFGFRANSRDGLGGTAFTVVSNFDAITPAGAVVPLPPAFALFAVALAGTYLVQRRGLHA